MSRFLSPKELSEHQAAFGYAYPDRVGSLVGGKSLSGEVDPWTIIYPATATQIAEGQSLSEKQVDEAATLAGDTFRRGDWSRKPLSERQRIMRAIADGIEAAADELAFLQCCETGLPYKQIRANHVPRAAENFRFFADAASTLAGETYQQTGRYISMTLHEPVGVGAVISPWNAPLALSSMKIAACIVGGNSCVLKPSEYTPHSLYRMVEIMLEAGMPEGAMQIVNGLGPSTGAALVAHPEIGAINFVGGTTTGARIAKGAADGIKKVALELGGKSANIVLDDAVFEDAVDGSMVAIFAGNGEQCLAGSRLLLQRSMKDRFLEAYVSRAEKLKIGDPFNPDVEIGPLAFAAHYQRVAGFVDAARRDGAEILAGGNRPEGCERGYFIEPVIALSPNNATSICQEEIFGPFCSIVLVDDLDEAIGIANDSDFGLVSYVWTTNLNHMMKAAQGIRAGTVWVNTPMARDLRTPFGGYKQSGVGRDGLPGSMELFTEQKTVMLPTGALTLPKLGMGD